MTEEKGDATDATDATDANTASARECGGTQASVRDHCSDREATARNGRPLLGSGGHCSDREATARIGMPLLGAFPRGVEPEEMGPWIGRPLLGSGDPTDITLGSGR